MSAPNMTEGDDAFAMILQGQHMAQTLILKALIATHPNPELLRAAVDVYVAQSEAFFAQESLDALQVEWFRMTLASLKAEIDA